MECPQCREWMNPDVNREQETSCCPLCSHVFSQRLWPLFVVAGPSGAGKTAIVAPLQRLLPDWDIFETDILWDSGRDWQMVKCNWLRVAHALAEAGRPAILCGTMQPHELDLCESRRFFRVIHWLALVCDPSVLAARLRARPAWRGSSGDAFIAQSLGYVGWLRKYAQTEFNPPLTFLDTTDAPVIETAARVRDWAVARWKEEQE